MINTLSETPLVQITKFYEEAFGRLDADRPIPAIDVTYYPYISLNQTIRVRDGRVFVRIAEMCRDMPAEFHRALAYILVAKLLRKRVPKWTDEVYSSFVDSAEMRERANDRKRSHGRKIVTTHKGEVYDLEEIFENLNFWYFGGQLAKPVLTWSAKKTYRILAHHDATHETIVVSKSLDATDVPRFVVEYIVFHEMLHIKHPTVHHNGRRYNHTPAFRRDERNFPEFQAAEDWIERSIRKLKRRARKK
ncbi:MAG: SprT-like domain-containing protein [Acidobacteriota bacterium]